jgi:Rrf2 family protein
MITISKKVEYSIVFIAYLAKNDMGTVSLTEVSKKLMLPYRFLGQLALALRVAGIVESKEGKSGGYFLSAGWNRKTLYDLLEALGENKHMVKCLSKGGEDCARMSKCEVRKIWTRIEDSFVKELKQIKLSEI